MAPKDVHRIIQGMRSPHDEEILDLVRETVAQLNKLGDRLEQHIRREEGEDEPHNTSSEEAPDV